MLPTMRSGFILAAALTAISTISAGAEEWCGYPARAKAHIECGYSAAMACQNAVGKGGVCFVNPEYALNSKRETPVIAAKLSSPRN